MSVVHGVVASGGHWRIAGANGGQSCHACAVGQVHGNNPRTPRIRCMPPCCQFGICEVMINSQDIYCNKMPRFSLARTGNPWQQLVMADVSICKVSAASSPRSLSRSRIVSSTVQWYDYFPEHRSVDWTAYHMSNNRAVFSSRADQRPPSITSHWYGR
jgi:hypothetical protein